MARVSRRLALPCAALAAIIAAGVAAQTPPIYRYTDPSGRVIYTDHMPPANAKNVEAKRLTQNMIETDRLPLEAQRAQDRFPVTLYTFACGDVCDKAEALLNRRGVPFAVVDVKTAQGQERLKKATGDTQVPVLQAGDKLIAKGYSDTMWQALLDDAGYPKAPVSRRAQQPLDVPKGAATKAAAPGTAPAAAPEPAPPPAPAKPGGYPKL
jgi:glutaredoxin